MLISERAQRLSVTAQAYRQQLEADQQDQQLAEAIHRFDGYVADAARALSLYREAKQRGVSTPPGQAEVFRTAAKHTKALRRELAKEDVGGSVLSRKPYENARSSADKVIAHLERLANDSWGLAFADRFTGGLENVRVPDLPGIASQAARVASLSARARAESKSPLGELAGGKTASELFDRLEELSVDLASARQQLEAALADVPPDVRQFIDAAGSEGGAPLSLLTDSVRAWLAAHHKLDGYRAVLR